ncbi:MAG: tRNA (adenosine(37)-N6)-threonylcarbamoyltransferase complex transferase subunit TsaD [Deltaproteobacteria bacterium HGW-Deltaproteobacteria-24]|nr:MAG: tRNA (adenosine(37)-N6)-threonylcarbamoyltransferase complex transferase subunit TsaD [Deltaproteobacteria bacterium HGW-Deltaproteobacteria-24]
MILSIESSCDDSSIAVTEIKTQKLIYHKKISQELQHSVYGGVVPELAARLHVEALPKILEECKTYFPFLKAIAVTNAPGLAVTLMEGVTMAKALSLGLNVPLIAVNHLKGHIYSLFIDQEVVFPMMVLLVSGGHTQVIEVENLNQMQVLAKTIDDSFGESFDKVAKMLNLGYPGGPIVQEYALKGDENKYELPIPLSQSAQVAFSYSGLKNAVRLTIEKEEELTLEVKQNICASFQKTAVAHIMQKMKKLFKQNPPKHFAIVGGASANIHLRTQIEQLCQQYNTTLHLSQLQYCSDNAAMIGRVAVEQYKAGDFTAVDELDVFSRTSL